MKRTISGIDVSCFTLEPTPAELAGIVADMPSEDAALFFCNLAEQLSNQGLSRYAIQNIADAVFELEQKLCDGGASRLIRFLAAGLKEHA